MATIKEQLEGHTSDIITATQKLLEDLSDREGQFVWKQLTAEGGDFVAFVTADDEGSYPNKGTQDGYYYVKFDPLTAIAENIREGVDIWGVIGAMSEGLSAEALGFSNIEVKKITFSSDTASNTKIAHSLNKIPKVVIIKPKSTPSGTYMLVGGVFSNLLETTSTKDAYFVVTDYNGKAVNISQTLNLTTTDVSNTNANRFYKKGIEYTFTFMA